MGVALEEPQALCTADKEEDSGSSSVGVGEVNASLLLDEDGNLGGPNCIVGLGEIKYPNQKLQYLLFLISPKIH